MELKKKTFRILAAIFLCFVILSTTMIASPCAQEYFKKWSFHTF